MRAICFGGCIGGLDTVGSLWCTCTVLGDVDGFTT